MASLKVVSDRLDDNSLKLAVVIPVRRNGEPNFACLERLIHDIHVVNPDAFDPVSAPEIARADGITADGAGIILDELMTPEKAAAAQRFLSECATGGCE